MTEAIWKGLALGSFLAISVGPVIFTIIKQSLNNGKEGGLSFVAGVWVSDILLVFLSNAFSEWVSALLAYKKTIGYVGSVFLIVLGVYYVFWKKVKLSMEKQGEEQRFRKRDVAKIFTSGFLINTLNPSVILFWLVNATAFSITHSLTDRIIIFSVCIAVNIVADVLKVLMAEKLRKKLTLHNLSVINKISGLILIGFGFALFWGVAFLSDKV
ncbi:LysE family translocator [Flavihumibacter petaseus]|uniref:Putative RhtB family transporter n=1 Tax=Flavihumibacter petaseus NBRC 106054 TaxID=1220578 RepID=A0A0E9MXU1_9BACT|nr:LysE family transporter [Flavihumibacter petaseus]GAO42251.1 putative RhtB family transporter [Flavihumibacter petaseus NBRC 106054]